MSTVPEVTTGDKIKGKLKEGLGKVTGDKHMVEEGKAVKVNKHSLFHFLFLLHTFSLI